MADPSQFFDEKGKPLRVDDPEAAKQAVLAGQVRVKKGNNVGIRTNDGRIVEVAPENLVSALKYGDLVPDEELNKTRIESKWEKRGLGDLSRSAIAFGAGAIHGAGAGFLDPIIPAAAQIIGGQQKGLEAKELLHDVKTVNPISHTIGDVVGTVGSMALTGGESGAARLGARGALGAEKLAARGAIGAEKLAAREAAPLALDAERAATIRNSLKGIGAETEGAAVGGFPANANFSRSAAAELPQAAAPVAEAAIPVAETLAPKANALGGLRFGDFTPAGAISNMGSSIERGMQAGIEGLIGNSASARLVNRVASGTTRAGFEGAAYGLGGAISDATIGDDQLTAEKVAARIGHDALLFGAFGATSGALHGLVEAGVSKMVPKLRKVQAESYAMAFGAQRDQYKRIIQNGTEKDFVDVASQIVKPGDSLETIAKNFDGFSSSHSGQWDQFMGAVGHLPQARVSAAAINKQIKDEILDSFKVVTDGKTFEKLGLRHVPGAEPIVANIERYMESLSKRGEMPFTEARDIRINLQDMIGQAFGNPDAPYAKQIMKGVSGIFEKNIEEAAGRAAQHLKNPELLETYQNLKKVSGTLKDIERMIDAGQASRALQGSNISALSKNPLIAGAGGAMTGLAFGHGPMGIAGGVAFSMANKLARDRGPAVTGWLAGRLADMGTLQSFRNEAETTIEGGVRAFLEGKKFSTAKAGRPRGDDINTRYALLVAKVSEAKLNEDKTMKSIQQATAGMEQTAPNLQARVQASALNTLRDISARVPHGQKDLLQPALDKPNISEADKAKFVEYAEGALKPFTLLEDLSKGAVTPEKVAAVKKNHPELYKEIQRQIVKGIDEMSAKGEYVPYQQRIQLGTTFGVPTDHSMEPAYLKRLQANAAGGAPPQQGGQQQGGAPGPAKGPGKPPGATSNMTKMFGTVFDKRAAGMKNP